MYFVKFNLEGLLRGDYQSRMNGYAIGRQNGWMSANDIRELENLIERLVVTNDSGPIARSSVFRALNPNGLPFSPSETSQTLKAQVGAFERELILHTLEREGSLRKAARVLGVDHSTLVKKCRQYNRP